MYKLYYSAGTCSMAVHVALIETGAAFALVNCSLKDGKNRTPEFLKMNPRGQVPVLQDGELAIREGGAILTYLLDKQQSPLLPAGPTAERARALEWLMWCNASLHPAYSRCFWLSRTVKDEAQKQALLAEAGKQVQALWDEAEARLAGNKYLAGDKVTIADILFTVIANWTMGHPLTFGPNVKRLLKEISTRPAYQQALQAEGVEYKAAA